MNYYEDKWWMRMMVGRQGLNTVKRLAFEMPAKRTMVHVDEDFRWRLAPALLEWIARNTSDRVMLRFDAKTDRLMITADSDDDLTLIATAF